jgi:hypothetical protein
LLWLTCNHNTPKRRRPCKNNVLLPAGCWCFAPQSMRKRSKHVVTMMVWWLIDAWVASGLLIPVLWLFSITGRRILARSSNNVQVTGGSALPVDNKATMPNRGHMGRSLLAGLACLGAVILLFIGSFGDPITTMGDLYSTIADAYAPVSQPAVTPARLEVELAVEHDEAEKGRPDLARQAAVAAPQSPPAWTLAAMSAVTPPASPERPSKHVWRHGRRSPVSAYVTQSHRGTWLFPPTANAGSNN